MSLIEKEKRPPGGYRRRTGGGRESRSYEPLYLPLKASRPPPDHSSRAKRYRRILQHEAVITPWFYASQGGL